MQTCCMREVSLSAIFASHYCYWLLFLQECQFVSGPKSYHLGSLVA